MPEPICRSGAELAAATLTEQGLEALLFAPLGGSSPGLRRKAEPDWAAIHRELRRPGVTLLLLWEECRAIHSAVTATVVGASSTAAGKPGCRRPCDKCTLPVKDCVDYAGQTVEVADASTGELRTAQVFVAALGASNYTYAEMSWTQSLLDWLRQLGLAGMARAFEELAVNTRGAELDDAEWLGLLLDRELAHGRLRARLRYARLRHNAAVSITAQRVVSIVRCSRSWHMAAGSRNSRT